jgi:hypothetical protein
MKTQIEDLANGCVLLLLGAFPWIGLMTLVA